MPCRLPFPLSPSPLSGPIPAALGVILCAAAVNIPLTAMAETCEAVTYAPVYSDIYSGGRAQNVRLAATLSVRNVSPDAPLTLTAVSYHDTGGRVLHRSVDDPLELKPLETRDFTIDVIDLEGGSGANFLITWQADSTTPAPMIETVMLGGLGTKGFAFASRGRTISDSCGRTPFE